MKKQTVSLKFRRRMEGKTNFVKRLAFVKSGMDRLVLRKSNKSISAQVVRYDEKGDKVICSANSKELEKLGWPSRSNRPTAYLLGLYIASKMDEKDRKKEHVLDIGLSSPVANSIPFVFAKGCKDAGIGLRSNIEIDDSYYNAKSISTYNESKPNKNGNQFGKYEKVDQLNTLFNDIREKLKLSVSKNK